MLAGSAWSGSVTASRSKRPTWRLWPTAAPLGGGGYPSVVTAVSRYELRAPRESDFERVAEILLADELDDAGQVILGADFLRSEWGEVGFNLATDAWVALDDKGSVLGYGQARRTEREVVESWGVVDPACRGRGVGAALLDRIEARAMEMLAGSSQDRFRHSINAADGAAAELLAARGLRLLRHHWHMEAILPVPLEACVDPPGVSVNAFDPRSDLAGLVAVLDEALADDRSYRRGRFEEWAREELSRPTYDPVLWQVARVDGTLVGAVTAEASADGWISFLGVLAAARGRGIGTALLRHLFATLADRDVARALVNVDAGNPSKATAVYEGAGMRVVKRWDLWERPRRRD